MREDEVMAVLSEAVRIESWRFEQLHDAGYDRESAHTLSMGNLDLHYCIDLLKALKVADAHDPVELALAILL